MLAERGLTFRALAARTSELDPTATAYRTATSRRSVRTTEQPRRHGDRRPGARSGATYFAEYRLSLARAPFDEGQQRLTGALRNLQALQELVDAGVPAPPAGRLAELLSAAPDRRPHRRATAAQRPGR